jgi:hypothetical protein
MERQAAGCRADGFFGQFIFGSFFGHLLIDSMGALIRPYCVFARFLYGAPTIDCRNEEESMFSILS